MSVPFSLPSLALLFWGWASGLWWVAAGLILAAESPRLLRARWDFELRDHERVADLCSVAFLVLMAWQWFGSRRGAEGLLTGLVWMPVLFFALLLVQRFGAQGRVPLSALFWSMRRRGHGVREARWVRIDAGYAGVCMVSAACANPRTPLFFAGAAALVAWTLWPARCTGRRVGAWGVALGLAFALAWTLQAGLVEAQARMEQIALDFLRERISGQADAFRARTAIGDLGHLRLSQSILWRVEGAGRGPLLLREAAYDNFAHDSWFAQSGEFRPLSPEGEASWIVAAGGGRGARVRISGDLRRGQGVLPLPAGTVRLDGLNVGKAGINRLGAVRVEAGPARVFFEARTEPGSGVEDAPTAADVAVPARLRAALEFALAEAGAGQGRPRERAAALVRWFHGGFAYTTRLDGAGERRSLERFLAKDRRGHCEYFASAAVLMLRAAGIPARYATGFVASEWSGLEEALLVRGRHGHAWAQAWLDGRWVDVDATPPGWLEAEAAQAPAWRRGLDLLSWAGFRLERWRGGPEGEGREPGALWLLAVVPLAAWLAWRLTRRRRADRPAGSTPPGDAAAEAASPLAPLVGGLAELGFERPPGLPLRRWLAGLPLPGQHEALLQLAERHARWRFDPRAHSAQEAVLLEDEARRLARVIGARPPGGSAS